MSKSLFSRKSEDIEPHEILLDSLAAKKEAELGISEKKLEVPLLKAILQIFFLLCFLIILVLLAKTFQFQVLEGEKFSAQAYENKFIIRQIQTERGVIYDKNFNQLVFNLPSFDLICQKNELPQLEAEKEEVLKEISEITGKNLEDLKGKIDNSDLPELLVKENLSHEELILLETKIKELSGFQIRNNPVRDYKEGEVFAHLIGYTGKIKTEELKQSPELYSIGDWVGRTGIENFYEEILRKNPGKLQIERDATGKVISKEIISLPESGKSLVLWLDSGLQKKIEEALAKELQIVGVKKAAAVALNPKTGGVLALVSLPTFDNNLFQKGADQEELKRLLEDSQQLQPLFNRAVSGRYLTGSTIKPLIASAALEEGIINPDKKINCQGKILIQNPWDPSASTTKDDWTVHGWTDVRKAIAESCNVYFYTVGGGYGNQPGLGPTKIKEYLGLFGWNEKSGIDLPGEATGFVPDKKWKKEVWKTDWWDGDTYNLSIGQGFLQITPLEVAESFTVIANKGILYQPQIVRQIVDEEKNIVEEFVPEIIRENFIKPENLQVVKEGMRQAVTGVNSPQASAYDLNFLPVALAAKTGTAELGRDKYGNEYYHNWITVFGPYEDPEIVLTIIIEDIKGVQKAVIPVAKNILEWYFSSK